MLTLRTIARALGGEIAGNQVLCPGPGHSPRDRSLAIKLQTDAPDGFLIYSHANDDWQICRDHVRARLGLPDWEPGDERHAQRTIPQSHVARWDFACVESEIKNRGRIADDARLIEPAAKIWNDAVDPHVLAVEDYFTSRALVLPEELCGSVLRFHPFCPWRFESTGKTEYIPCLLAAFRSIDDDVLTGVHRIRLDRPWLWPKTERKMLGLIHWSAIKLDEAQDDLTVGEGIETCLAARVLGLGPVWAMGHVGGITKLPVLDGVRTLTILGEPGEANAHAVRICGQRWRQARRKVIISRSEVGSDHNDFLMWRAAS